MSFFDLFCKGLKSPSKVFLLINHLAFASYAPGSKDIKFVTSVSVNELALATVTELVAPQVFALSTPLG